MSKMYIKGVLRYKAMSKVSKMYIKGVLRYINTRDHSNVEDVEDRSNTRKGCNAMYVEDVEDRSNTSKGCNAMYVEDVEDGKRTYHTFWLGLIHCFDLLYLCISTPL